MTELLFSALLKQKREELGITQREMAPLLGMKLRMYQDYESGKYDKSALKKKDFYVRKLAALKNNNTQVSPSDMEKEILRLREVIEGKDRIIDAQVKALIMAERLLNTFTRKVASGISPSKRKN